MKYPPQFGLDLRTNLLLVEIVQIVEVFPIFSWSLMCQSRYQSFNTTKSILCPYLQEQRFAPILISCSTYTSLLLVHRSRCNLLLLSRVLSWNLIRRPVQYLSIRIMCNHLAASYRTTQDRHIASMSSVTSDLEIGGVIS